LKSAGETALEKLLSLGSEPLAANPAAPPALLEGFTLGHELFRMLQRKNGFYAFESALHVFPLSSRDSMSLEEWNSVALWREGYGDLTNGLLFFAEDAFQDQFCLSATGVLRFIAETGRTKPLADSIEDWASTLLRDFGTETRWTLASAWQCAEGPLAPGKRLMPKAPFFLGGAYSVGNLWAGDAVEGMRFKADLAAQTKDLPDGASVRLVIGKTPTKQ
jgi:hypothetical protein